MTSPVNFTQKVAEVKEQLKCPITLQQITDPHCIFPCRHTFDGPAIIAWSKRSPTCPLDRCVVTDITPDFGFQALLQKFLLSKQKGQNLGELVSLEQEISRYKSQAFSASVLETQARIDSIRKKLFNAQETGLYLIGNCENQRCSQNDKEVAVFKGVGQFSMNKESVTTRCQDCDLPMSIEAIAIRSKDYEIEGMKVSGDYEEEKKGPSSSEQQEFKIISPLSDWRFLDVKIEKPGESGSKAAEINQTGNCLECLKSGSVIQWITNIINKSHKYF